MRRPLLLAALLLMIAAAFFVLLRGGAPEEPPTPESAGAATAQEPGAASSVPPADASPAAGREPAVGRTEVRDEPSADATASSHPGPWLLIEVVRGEPALPAPHASVWVLTPEQSRQQELMMAFLTGMSVPELLTVLATAHQADAAGRLRVPLPRDHGMIAAELDDGFVMNEWEPTASQGEDHELRLTLTQASAVEVLVVDETGRPLAGAPVSIRFGDENFQFDLLRDRTGADGVARMKHVAAFLQTFSPGADVPVSVALTSPLPEPVSAPLDLENPPSEPIRLVMPAHGRMEVETRHADGTPAEDGLVVFLSIPLETAEDDDDFFIPGLPGFESIAARTAGGVALFPYVGVGLQLMATAAFPGAPEATRVAGDGPMRPGATARLILTESLEYPLLTGRLLGADGQPAAAQTVELRIDEESNQFGMEPARTVTTGTDGTFRIAMRSAEMIPIAQAAELVLIQDGVKGAQIAPLEIPPLRIGDNPVGDLHLRAAPVLAAGRVLGPDGNAVPGATVGQMHWVQWDEDDPANGQWMEEWNELTECAPDGSFTLHGSAPAEGLRLYADAPGHLRKEMDVTPGMEGIEFRLEAGGSLRGRVLADPGIPLGDLLLTLIVPDSLDEDDGQQWTSIEEDGEFAFEGLRPGVGTLTVSGSWGDDEAHVIIRIEGIAVGPGAPADPRLDPIDLRGRLHACRLTVSAEDGSEIDELQVWRVEAPQAPFHGWDGEVVAFSPLPLGRLVVSAKGFRRTELEATRAEMKVVLRRGPEILLRIPPSAARFDGVTLGVQIIRDEQDGGWNDQPRGFFAPDGTLRLHVQDPGGYGAIFIATRETDPDAEGWGFTWLRPEEGQDYERFTVAETGSVQTVMLTPPSAARVLEEFEDEPR